MAPKLYGCSGGGGGNEPENCCGLPAYPTYGCGMGYPDPDTDQCNLYVLDPSDEPCYLFFGYSVCADKLRYF